MTANVLCGDALGLMAALPNNSVDLVFTSPPYELARTYGIGFKHKGRAWVDWYMPYVEQMLRVCKGLVAIVVQGQTRNYRWSATPAYLATAIDSLGFCLRNPPIFNRVGIPGSGGPDWLRSDYEWVICATREQGRLPWSDNTAMGAPPKYSPGGAMSHRLTDGQRKSGVIMKTTTSGYKLGDCESKRKEYKPPSKANPGNVIKLYVGKGHMGSDLCHENEAPFPEKLAEFFIRSFCPPTGIVLDPMCGSGTTCAVASQFGRSYIGYDIRQSQVDLTIRRLAGGTTPPKGKKHEPVRQILRSS